MNLDPETSRVPMRLRRRRAAFSLVEIALSLGIMGFALVAVFGLLPLGLSTFRKAADLSVGSQIAQAIVGEAQQADFDALIESRVGSLDPFQKPLRYFDAQGEETPGQTLNTLYWVNTRVVPTTTMAPGIDGKADTTNRNIATVTVQVATNSANAALQIDGKSLLIPKTGLPIQTFSAYVARSSPIP